nr:aromatic acid decarboxylase [Betaproteobacteria bacterium]
MDAPTTPTTPTTVTLAFTGASGMPFGLRLLECLVAAQRRIYLLYSSAAQVVAKHECDLVLPAQPRAAARLFSERCGARDNQITVFARDD